MRPSESICHKIQIKKLFKLCPSRSHSPWRSSPGWRWRRRGRWVRPPSWPGPGASSRVWLAWRPACNNNITSRTLESPPPPPALTPLQPRRNPQIWCFPCPFVFQYSSEPDISCGESSKTVGGRQSLEVWWSSLQLGWGWRQSLELRGLLGANNTWSLFEIKLVYSRILKN